MKAETLKKAILQYAMQGKLVEQDSNDEPASILLERIKAEKERLIKDGKIKKEKPLPPITEDEIPYELPKGWEWVKLGEICTIINGFTPLRTNSDFWLNGNIPWFTVDDIRFQGHRIKKTAQYITEKALGSTSNRILPKGTVLLCCTASVGEYAIAEIPLTTNQQFNGLVINDHWQKYYYNEFLLQLVKTFQDKLINLAGKTTFNFISVKKVSNIIVPFPPLAEQERIVEKLEQILPLVEEYGKNEEKLSKLNSTLPDKIKQSILQYAVQGKLVPQNPSDEPASELLKRIKAEKEQLIKDGKIKKEKPLPPITEDEIPYELPQGWEWVRLSSICEILNGYAFKSDTYVSKSNNQIIRLGNVKNNGLVLEASPAYIPSNIAETAENYLLKENDILVTLTGTRLKRDYFYTSLVESKDIKHLNLYLNQRVGCLRFYSGINPKLLNIFLKSKFILDNIFEHETGTANQGNIGTGATGNLLIPIPPLAEQQRIVTKVEELLAIVKSLKKG